MPFRNRKKYFRGSFQLSIVIILKNITPIETGNLRIRHFPKLKIAYYGGKKSFQFFLSLSSLQILWAVMD